MNKQKQYHILSTRSGFNDCLRFSEIRPDELKTRSDVTELAGTPNNNFANIASCGNIRECLFHHFNNVSSFVNKIYVLR